MSEEQLSALLKKLKDNSELREKLEATSDLDSALGIAKEAGFDVTKADLTEYQAKQTLDLGDNDLERIAGGTELLTIVFCISALFCDRNKSAQCHGQITDSVT